MKHMYKHDNVITNIISFVFSLFSTFNHDAYKCDSFSISPIYNDSMYLFPTKYSSYGCISTRNYAPVFPLYSNSNASFTHVTGSMLQLVNAPKVEVNTI